MKMYWGVEVHFHAFLTSALDGGEWSALHSDRFTPGERPLSTHWTGGCLTPRAGLDAVTRRKISRHLPGIRPLSSSPCLITSHHHHHHSHLLSKCHFPWYLSCWTNCASHHSGFKFQTVALFLLHVMSLAQLFFVENPPNASLVLFPHIL
jgi:hypothetical protein